MFSKLFIQFLCLSLALVEIKAMVRIQKNENDISQEKKELEPNQEPEHRHHGDCHKHKHHHHRGHHDQHENMPQGEMSSPPQRFNPHHHEMLTRLGPLFKVFLNKDYHKKGWVKTSEDSKIETESNAKALVMSKTNSIYTETLISKDMSTNKSQLLTKRLEQNAETDVIIDFNSDMDVISDKTLKANSEEESKPVHKLDKPELKKVRNHKPGPVYPVRTLRRMKRSDEKTGDSISAAFNKLGEAIKAGYNKHVVEPAKKFMAQAKAKMEEMKKNHQNKKAGQTTVAPENQDQTTVAGDSSGAQE